MRIKLITGMFKMVLCELSVAEDAIIISTPDSNRRIPLSDIENISLTRRTGRNARLEIILKGETIEGVFDEKADADEFADSLKECMGSVLQINFHG